MIKAIIFDWGGVLIKDPTEEIAAYCAKKLGVNKNKLIRLHKEFQPDFERGALTEKELWKKTCKRLDVAEPKNPHLWTDAFRCYYSENKKVIALARSLKDREYKLGFLSNIELPGKKILDEHKRSYDFFDAFVLSFEEKTIKPEKRIYKIMLDRLRVKPDEALFIDNNKDNVNGARKAGIKSILFRNYSQLKRDIIKRHK